MVNPARRTVLVTGASAGIGAAFARVFAEHGFDLVVTARRQDRLEALAREVGTRWQASARVVVADLADPAAPAHIEADMAAAGLQADALVNNAGYGVPGKFTDRPWLEHTDFLQVMVTAVADLSHRVLPGMIARGYGRIVNVSSLAGLLPGTAGHTLYAATKAFMVRMSQSLALESAGHNVHVTALCPGFTHTEFHDVTGTRDLVRTLPAWMWMDADRVAREGYDAVMRGKVTCVPGRINRAIAAASRCIPERLLLAVMQRQAKRYRRS